MVIVIGRAAVICGLPGLKVQDGSLLWLTLDAGCHLGPQRRLTECLLLGNRMKTKIFSQPRKLLHKGSRERKEFYY